MKIDSNARNSSRVMNRSGFRINVPGGLPVDKQEKSSNERTTIIEPEEAKPAVTERLSIAIPTTIQPVEVNSRLITGQEEPEAPSTTLTLGDSKHAPELMECEHISVSQLVSTSLTTQSDNIVIDECAELKEKIELLESEIEMLTYSITTKDEMIKALKDYAQVSDEELQLAIQKQKSLLDITGKFIMKI